MVIKKKDWNAEFELAKVKKWEKIEHIYYIVVALMGFLICMITFARFVDIAEEFAILIIVIGVLFLINWTILSLIVFRMKRDYIKNKNNKIHKTAGNVYDTFTELNLSSGRINVPNLEEVDPSDLVKEVLPEKREFVINEFITLKLEGGKTNIYVNGEYFRNCMFLMLNLNVCRIEQYDSIKSIDDAEDRLSNTLETFPAYKDLGITLEELFKGHCSNIQVWAENNYDTRILHRNLAFPLLKELTKSGDQQARKVFKEEIGRRFVEGNDKVRNFLSIEGYLNYLNVEEIVSIFEIVLKRDRKISMHINLIPNEKERNLFTTANRHNTLTNVRLRDVFHDGVSELDSEFVRERNRIYDNLIWDIDDDEDWDKPMEKKPFFKKLKDNFVLAYYDFLLIFWRIKRKKFTN